MKFSRGDITQPMTVVGETDHTGTTVRFKPDPIMFEDTVYDYETLHVRMREQAFLNAGLRITITDRRGEEPVSESMCYEGGIREFVDFINKTRRPCTPRPSICPASAATPCARSRCSITTAITRSSCRSPTTSTRRRAACTRPASRLRSPARSMPTAKSPVSSRRATASPARTAARASRLSSPSSSRTPSSRGRRRPSSATPRCARSSIPLCSTACRSFWRRTPPSAA